MIYQHRDRLSFAAVFAGSACVVLVAGVLYAVLRAPAVPRPRGLIRVVEEIKREIVPPAAARPPADRDSARVPATAETATDNFAPPQRLASAPPPAADIGAATRAAAVSAPETSTVAIKSNVASPGNSASRAGAPPPGGAERAQRGLVILQIGDSHTAADYFTGELRRKLQARYGDGGVGYIDAGKPTVGVRSGTMRITASAGWTYRAIQRSESVGEFWLSGFNAVTGKAGEVLTFASDNPVPFDEIEIEALRQPNGGEIEISLDGTVKSSADLNGSSTQPVVLRLKPDGAPSDRVKTLEIRTGREGAVTIASIGIYQKQSGVSFNNVGYPGATIDLINKFDASLMADDLRRLDPQIVVLAFGTNEASKPNFNAAAYERNYEKVIGRITAALPNVRVILIGPPDGAERPWHCSGKGPADAPCHAAPPESAASATEPPDCEWHTIAHLELVRDIERRIAERHGFTYWNWASIQPGQCASHQWVAASLMTPDHVHFTPAGYVKGANQFLEQALIPTIEKLAMRPNIAAND